MKWMWRVGALTVVAVLGATGWSMHSSNAREAAAKADPTLQAGVIAATPMPMPAPAPAPASDSPATTLMPAPTPVPLAPAPTPAAPTPDPVPIAGSPAAEWPLPSLAPAPRPPLAPPPQPAADLGATSPLLPAPSAAATPPPPSPADSIEKQVRMLSLRYRDPADLLAVCEILPVECRADSPSRQLLVVGPPAWLDRVDQLVQQLDVPALTRSTTASPAAELKIYRLRDCAPQDAMRCVEPFLSAEGRAVADDAHRLVMVKDRAAVHAEVARVLSELDPSSLPQSVAADPRGETVVPLGLDVPQTGTTPAAPPPISPAVNGDPKGGASHPTGQTVRLKLRVCELDRPALQGVRPADASASNPWLDAVLAGKPMSGAYDLGHVDIGLRSLASVNAVRVVAEPTILALDGQWCSFETADAASPAGSAAEPTSPEGAPSGWSNCAWCRIKIQPNLVSPGHLRVVIVPEFGRGARHPTSDDAESKPPYTTLELAAEGCIVLGGPWWKRDRAEVIPATANEPESPAELMVIVTAQLADPPATASGATSPPANRK